MGTGVPIIPDDTPTGAGNYPLTPRQFQADFATALATLSNASIIRRPDAISLDYLTSFSRGPVAIGDVSQGTVPFIWRVRVTNDPLGLNSQVFFTRETSDQTNWNPDTLLFSFAGPPITEIDCAFDQSGRIVVVAERPSSGPEVWIYWFNPLHGVFEFDDFGAGRTPRAILDNPDDPTNSDIQVFYIHDSVGIVYRQQRDAYSIEHTTPIASFANTFLEDVVKLTDTRLRVIFSIRDPHAGTYSLGFLESLLFPYLTDVETEFLFYAILGSSTLITTLVPYTTFDIDTLHEFFTLIEGTLGASLIDYTTFDIDSLTHAYILLNTSTLVVTLITYPTFDIDSQTPNYIAFSGTLVITLIQYTTFDIDSLTHAYTLKSGTLV